MANISHQFEVIRKDAESRRVYGWFSIAKDKDGNVLVDRHGDVIDPSELETAAADFLKEFRQGGINHAGAAPHDLIASVVLTKELQTALGIPPGILPEGWFGGFEISESAFGKIANGDLLMFSIEGEAETEMVEVA
jgi:hypothetical protein